MTYTNQPMKTIYLIIFSLFLYHTKLYGQEASIGQYFQMLPAYAPGLSGAHDYTDLRVGYRQQWVGFEGAPTTAFIGAHGVIKRKQNPNEYNSVRASNLNPYTRRPIKVGFGTYLFVDEFGVYKRTSATGNVAIHVLINKEAYLSFGVSAGLDNMNIDLSKVFVLDPDNDLVYQAFVEDGPNNTTFKLNAGLAFYTPQYYLSYAAFPLINKRFKVGEYTNNDVIIQHNIIAGWRFDASPSLEISPNTFIRYSNGNPFLFDAGVRVKYNRSLFAGISYRNDNSMIPMVGFLLKGKYRVWYSYEHKFSDYSRFNSDTHEVVLGIQLGNSKKLNPIW